MIKNDKYIPLSKPFLGKKEEAAVISALRSGWITLGPKTHEFENAFQTYVGSKFAVAVSSWTAGLHIVLTALGIGPEDEVIAPVFTFAATINPIIHVGAKPILVDISSSTFTIDPILLEKAITKKTRAIIPVHYAGHAADMNQIMKIAKKYNLIVIEDAAHAVGSTYNKKKIGSISDITIFSFHPIKNITTGDGGMISTNLIDIAEKCRLLRLHGMSKEAWKRLDKSGNWYYEIVLPGYKYNMTDISASIGLEQLAKLNSFIEQRTKIADYYNNQFSEVPEISTPITLSGYGHSWNLYSILLNIEKLSISRNEFIEILKDEGIGSSVYFTPLHFHPYYKKALNYNVGDFPQAEWVYERLICLPMYNSITLKEAKKVVNIVKSIILKYRLHG